MRNLCEILNGAYIDFVGLDWHDKQILYTRIGTMIEMRATCKSVWSAVLAPSLCSVVCLFVEQVLRQHVCMGE